MNMVKQLLKNINVAKYVFGTIQVDVRVSTMDVEMEFSILHSTTGKTLFEKVLHVFNYYISKPLPLKLS